MTPSQVQRFIPASRGYGRCRVEDVVHTLRLLNQVQDKLPTTERLAHNPFTEHVSTACMRYAWYRTMPHASWEPNYNFTEIAPWPLVILQGKQLAGHPVSCLVCLTSVLP